MQEDEFNDIWFNGLTMCGCGRPDELKQFIKELLIAQSQDLNYEEKTKLRNEILEKVDKDLIFEFIFHRLEYADLVQHGGSVYGSWLTDKGKAFITAVDEFKESE
jgi:hypothetical protein